MGEKEFGVIRLGLVLDQIIFEKDGRWSTDEAFIQFVEMAAAQVFDRIQFCSRVRASSENAPYALDPAMFDIVPLPWYANIEALCLRSPVLIPRIVGTLARAMLSWDMAMVSGIHPLTPLVLRMARRRRIPAALWIRGNLDTDLLHRFSGARRVAATAVARLLLRLIPPGTPVISVGRGDYPFLSRLGPVHIVYSSKFDTDDLRPLPLPVLSSGARPRLLYVGRLSAEKGLDVLLEAIRIMAASGGRRPSLSVVGDDYHGGTYGNRFRRLVEQRRLGDAVELAGHVPYGPDLFHWYDTHDLLVLPSYTEGFPQVIFEAQMRGLPVVATAVGGIPGVIESGRNGLLVPPGDPQALADAMQRILADPALARRLAEEAQASLGPYTRRRQVEALLRYLARCHPESRFAARLGPAVR
ncbi:MAG: glycosyltransferase family 4 protein [Acidobacteriota bacterium]